MEWLGKLVTLSGDDEEFMRMAIEESKKSEDEKDGRVHPKVGVVIVKDGSVLVTAHRGEYSRGDHAEYTALERKSPSIDLTGATIYTTLEPCASRGHKTPCVERIIQRKIARVVIGIVDPNPAIIGGSIGKLKTSEIEVSFTTPELENEIKSLNKEFLEDQAKKTSKTKLASGSELFERRLTEIVIPYKEKEPYAQIVVGPLTEGNDYLNPSPQNASLFTSFTPSFLVVEFSTPRRDRYQFKSFDQRNHFEVYVDGYLHARFPIAMENAAEVLLGAIMFRISSFLFYTIRILRMRNVTAGQKIHIELSGFQNIEIALTQSRLRLSRYFFAADREEHIFEREFDPSENWKTAFFTACAIYGDILVELGVTGVTEDQIRAALKCLVEQDTSLRTEYILTSGETVPRIDLKELFES